MYERGKKRSLVSLKMMIISWLIELIGSLFAYSFVTLNGLGIRNMHYPDCIILSIIIPFVHLMNDAETKGIIADQNFYQGIRHILGIYQEKRNGDQRAADDQESLNRRGQ